MSLCISMKTTEITAGLFVRNKVRNYLAEMKFKTRNIEFIESKYLLDSHFVVKGQDLDIDKINRDLAKYLIELDGVKV